MEASSRMFNFDYLTIFVPEYFIKSKNYMTTKVHFMSIFYMQFSLVKSTQHGRTWNGWGSASGRIHTYNSQQLSLFLIHLGVIPNESWQIRKRVFPPSFLWEQVLDKIKFYEFDRSIVESTGRRRDWGNMPISQLRYERWNMTDQEEHMISIEMIKVAWMLS